MLQLIFWLLVAACVMLIAHEAGHVITTKLLGGRFLGIQYKGFLVGVRLSVDHLSRAQVAATLAAGPAAEVFVVFALTCIAPRDAVWWLLVLALQWIGNVIPWGLIPNDGTRLWQLWRRGAIDTPS